MLPQLRSVRPSVTDCTRLSERMALYSSRLLSFERAQDLPHEQAASEISPSPRLCVELSPLDAGMLLDQAAGARRAVACLARALGHVRTGACGRHQHQVDRPLFETPR